MRDTIEAARKHLGISPVDCCLVSPHQHLDITEQIAKRFTKLSQNPLKCRWWWENFKEPTRSVKLSEPLSTVADLLGPNEIYWFIVEAWEAGKKESAFWLYEMSGQAILLILREVHFFEYYIVDRKMTWLLCENHHNFLIGVGDSILQRLPKK
jgi:hypothetical protein